MKELDPLLDAVADAICERVSDRLLAKLEERASAAAPDPLLKVPEAARYLGLTKEVVYELTEQGHLQYAKGLAIKRFRRSTLDNYGKANPSK